VSEHVHRLGWRLPVIGVSIVGLLLAGFAAGIATRGVFAQPNGTTIYACKGERSGSVRLLNGPGSCMRGEVLVTWNSAGQAGPQGPPGDPGPQGDPGLPGGLSGYTFQQIIGATVILNPGEVALYAVECPQGTVALSGGWNTGTARDVVAIQSQRSESDSRVWVFSFFSGEAAAFALTPALFAVCAEPAAT
jgi:hypothetical protein